jgi:hypothetical protein
MVAGVAVLLGLIFVGIAGNNSHSALATTAGLLLILGIPAAFVCATAALWRRLGRGKFDQGTRDEATSLAEGNGELSG